MSNQNILEQLSEIECALFYRKDGSDNAEGVSLDDLETAHKLAKTLLEFWYKKTGCTLI